MCGIAGLVGAGDRSILSEMRNRLVHRGPDDSGEFFDEAECVGLAMQRLSILDIEGGHPLDNNVVIRLRSFDELDQAKDLKSFAEWMIESSEPDFMSDFGKP